MTHKGKMSGFTLVELLLAVTLMAILMSLAYGGLRASVRASETGQRMLEESGKIRITHQFIRRQLNQMLPLTFALSDDLVNKNIVFEGSADHVSFVAPMPGYLGQGGPQVQTLSLANGHNGVELLFTHQLLQGYDEQMMLDQEPIVLMEGLKSGGFEFLVQDEDGYLVGWVSEWDTPEFLPIAVRLDLETGRDLQAIWPTLVATAKTDEGAAAAAGASQSYQDAIRSLVKKSKDSGQ